MTAQRPWTAILTAVRSRGEVVAAALEAQQTAELELLPRKERKRVETVWNERIRRMRRRAQTGALDLALQIVALWYSDLAAVALDAPDLVRHADRIAELREDIASSPAPARLRDAIELVEETRQRLQLNVSEELACEALGYRLQSVLAR